MVVEGDLKSSRKRKFNENKAHPLERGEYYDSACGCVRGPWVSSACSICWIDSTGGDIGACDDNGACDDDRDLLDKDIDENNILEYINWDGKDKEDTDFDQKLSSFLSWKPWQIVTCVWLRMRLSWIL